MKKKFVASNSDQKEWLNYTSQLKNNHKKEINLLKKNLYIHKIQRLDLHGFSLKESNEILEKFIIDSFKKGCRKLLVITGKGSRSKSYNNPYLSEKLSVLRYSIPDFIKNNKYLDKMINKVTKADQKHGGEGAIYIYLKNNNKL